jgi:thiol:disulfide interchange protein DsbA
MFKGLLFALAGLVTSAAAVAADSPWVEGTNYYKIEPAQPTSTPGKVEVLEVFSFGCPACYQFNPSMKKIAEQLPKNAVIAYLPASFRDDEGWPLFQRAYYTALALGIEEKTHDAMFEAIWGPKGPLSLREPGSNKVHLPTLDDVAKFYAAHGVSAEDFIGTANSFAVSTKMKTADAYIKSAQVDSTPTLIINGKYRVTGQSAGDLDKLIAIVQYLVQKESGGH